MGKKAKSTFDLLLSIKNRTVSLRRDVDTIRRRFADEDEVERVDASRAVDFVMNELADLNESCGRMLEVLQSRGIETSAVAMLLAENTLRRASEHTEAAGETGELRMIDEDQD